MKNFIIKLLNLKEEDIDSIDIVSNDNSSTFFVKLKHKTYPCKHCLTPTSKIHSYQMRKVNYKALHHFDSTIYYNARRYYCIHCGKTFFEPNPFTSNRKSISNSDTFAILNALKPFNATYSQVARSFGVSVSTVLNIFDKHVQIERKTFSRVLCFDEFYFNRHSKYKYAFMILDFNTKVILDIVESRKQEVLLDYFFHIPLEERDNVQYICIDMYQPYLYLCHLFFKNATVCIDSFHVVKKVNDALDRVRKDVMRKYSKIPHSRDYKLLKHNLKLLCKPAGNIDYERYFKSYTLGYTTTENGLLEIILSIDPKLKKAYELKEAYLEFNDKKPNEIDKNELLNEMNEIILEFKKSDIAAFKEVGKTLNRYKKEILNSFVWFDDRRISNGPIEGKNTYIKKIISNANGLNNFERSRNRIMYSQNWHENYSVTEHEKVIKTNRPTRGPYKKK